MGSGVHSNLEVVPPSERADAQKYSYSPYSEDPIAIYSNDTSDTHKEIPQGAKYDETQAKTTICGLRRRMFWIVVIVAILVVVGAVSGGVGGALASRPFSRTGNVSSTESERSWSSLIASAGAFESQTASANTVGSSSAPRSPTTSTTSITTTSLVGPTATILRDCPSSNNSVYSVTTGNSVMQFRKTCERSYLNANGDDFAYARVTLDLNECINLCAAYNINNRDQIQQGKNRICNSVCWRNSFGAKNDETGGQCYGYTTQNVTSNGESAWRYRIPVETKCDGAALMNQEF